MFKYNHGFIVSRFQPFHNGHKSLVDKMLKESKYSTIILGSAQESRTQKNPFTAEERINMIKNGILILYKSWKKKAKNLESQKLFIVVE